jgi:hypothetical protein
MKPTEFIVENSVIAQEADDMHRDHEVQMARSQMYSSAQAAIEIHRLLRDISELEGLEGWVQSKLTLASQYLESVRDYLKYEAVSQGPEMMAFAESAAEYALESLISEEGMKDYVEKNPEKFNEPTRDLYARNTARHGGDDGQPGAKGERKSTGPTVDRSGKSVTGFATGVSKPEGVPRVSKTPITSFGGGSGGGIIEPGKKRSLYFDENKRSIKERIAKLERKIREQSTPVIGGMSQATAPGGDITTRSDIGGTSVSQTKTPGGFTKQTTANMDMGNAGSASMVKQAPQQPGQLAGTTTVTRTAAPTGPGQGSAAAATGSAVQGVAFGGASGKNVGQNVVTTGDTGMAQQAKQILKPPVQESATGGASSAGSVATSVGGATHKPTSGVPKRLGNSHKPKRIAVGKGIYDK